VATDSDAVVAIVSVLGTWAASCASQKWFATRWRAARLHWVYL